MGYNPSFINELTLDEMKGVLAHEVMHIANAHHVRRQGRDKETWNEATDYAINDLLLQSGFTLPKGGLKGYSNQSAEEIYSKLPKKQQNEQEGESGKGKGNDPGKCGEIRDAPGKDGQKATQAELAKAEAEAKVAVAQELLRRFVDQNAKNDYAWMPPNKRYIHMGLFMPSLRSQELKNIAVAIDTSGSINQEVLKEFVSELGAIMEAYDSNAYVMYVNNALQGVEEFTAYDVPLKLNAQGGGGTDFRPPFNHLEEKGMLPSCFIYLTDGQCSSFSNDPNYPVLWCIIGSTERFNPPFGEVIQIK